MFPAPQVKLAVWLLPCRI